MGFLLFSDTAACIIDGGRPRHESSLVESPGATVPTDRLNRIRSPVHIAGPQIDGGSSREPTVRRRLRTAAQHRAPRGAKPRRCGPHRPMKTPQPRVPDEDAHQDARGVDSTFGDRSQGRQRGISDTLLPRDDSTPISSRPASESSDRPIHPIDAVVWNLRRQPIAKGRQ